jgi:6-phosphofructokinase 1
VPFVLPDASVRLSVSDEDPRSDAFERAGPREQLFFKGDEVRAGLVTCGGLCPGLNHVVRAIVFALVHSYGCNAIKGYRYGYEGLTAKGVPPLVLSAENVRDIHRIGGTYLGASRGAQPVAEMVDTLVQDGISMLFTIGGDGTLRGAHAIAQEIAARKLPIAVVGVPKTIDNDIAFVDRTFGFETAVEQARTVLQAAHAEARSARNGVCVVQLMGRDAGFITASAALASGEVNVCLVPEVPFTPDALAKYLEGRLATRGHAVIVVAEGCAAQLGDTSGDSRGAKRDVAAALASLLATHFRTVNRPISIKVIDPSYTLRSVPSTADDAIYCDQLGRYAVHAAMSGRTDLVVGRVHRELVHVPLQRVAGATRRIEPDGELWRSVLEATGQPRLV